MSFRRVSLPALTSSCGSPPLGDNPLDAASLEVGTGGLRNMIIEKDLIALGANLLEHWAALSGGTDPPNWESPSQVLAPLFASQSRRRTASKSDCDNRPPIV